MRMWMINPELLCRNHLLGEHLEIHMFVGTILKNVSLAGYVERGLVEPVSFRARHDALVAEMLARCYNHHSPLKEFPPDLILPYKHARVNPYASIAELICRCVACRSRIWRSPSMGISTLSICSFDGRDSRTYPPSLIARELYLRHTSACFVCGGRVFHHNQTCSRCCGYFPKITARWLQTRTIKQEQQKALP